MEKPFNVGKILFWHFLISLVTSVGVGYCFALIRYQEEIYLDSFYNTVLLADTVTYAPFCFLFFYLFFLLIFSSTALPFNCYDAKERINRVMISVFFYLIVSFVGIFLLLPMGQRLRQEARYFSFIAVDSLEKCVIAYKKGDYQEALNFLRIYESVDEKHEVRFTSFDDGLSYKIKKRGEVETEETKKYWMNSENVANELIFLIRSQEEVYPTTDASGYALKKLAFEKYSFGKENGYFQPLGESFKIFNYLSHYFPEDEEITLHMNRAESEIRKHVLVRDRIQEESIFPLSRNICFLNIDNDEVRQIISARKLISITGRDIVEDIRVETTEKKTGRKSFLVADYGRLEKDRILFDSVWLHQPEEVIHGRFEEGGESQWVNEHFVPLKIRSQLLPLLDFEQRAIETIPFFDLIGLMTVFPEEVEMSTFVEREIISRSVFLIFIILAPFMMILWGLRMAPQEKIPDGNLRYMVPFVILAVALSFFLVMIFAEVVAAVAVLKFSPSIFFIAFPVATVLLLISHIIVFVTYYNYKVRD